MGRYLGLDSSTQSLTAVVIDTDRGEVVAARSISFGEKLPEYRSPHGFLPNEDPRVRHSDPLMWVEALDRIFEELRQTGCDLGKIRGISGAGQQHGSVYLGRSFEGAAAWRTGAPLRDQVRPLLSRPTAPIWMDSSTSTECAEIAAAAGGDERVVSITGSRAIERFTGPQIRKFYKQSPDAYAKTVEIHLVSSFIASILAGARAGIDFGDGAGMDLLDLSAGRWSPVMLAATAPDLQNRLPPPVPCATEVGTVADYFVEKYGFAPKTPVLAFTGDNPSSLVGMGATKPGTAVVSLGTSDTFFAAMNEPRTDPRGYGHVFGNPAGGFMSLICFSNGSLARERIARQFGLDWEAFARAIVDETPPGNHGNLLLPYFVPEITPKLLEPKAAWFGSDDFVAQKDGRAAARAVVEAQALSMKLHADWIGIDPKTILVTGGASRNRGILQVLADVFQAELRPLAVTDSSALGGALRAAHAVEKTPWESLYARFCAPDPSLRIKPNPEAKKVYAELGAEHRRRLADIIASERR